MAPRFDVKNLYFLCLFIGASLAASYNETLCCRYIHESDYDAFYDFKKRFSKHDPQIKMFHSFTGSGCSMRGVFKLEFGRGDRLLIDMIFEDPQGWVYNLGDSSTNNGYGGDAGTQSNDAEMQLYGTLSGYYSDVKGSQLAFGMANNNNVRATLLAGDHCVTWYNECDPTSLNYFCSKGWFALNDDHDSEGPVNNDLYLGVNRAIGAPELVGKGVCKIGFKWIRGSNTY
ncbi:uncharacterized protein LOC129928258 [Biomphalaria glabrata]|uniref:Uncharacterized protein LOC129928258 n=1 Tax=Biomphalaria glabrata TaxID=6526 RepID=A0A9W3BDW0_BIOGL|nr:uncharacterized protein LOC129928258 [Biomphalaria glabrata]